MKHNPSLTLGLIDNLKSCGQEMNMDLFKRSMDSVQKVQLTKRTELWKLGMEHFGSKEGGHPACSCPGQVFFSLIRNYFVVHYCQVSHVFFVNDLSERP